MCLTEQLLKAPEAWMLSPEAFKKYASGDEGDDELIREVQTDDIPKLTGVKFSMRKSGIEPTSTPSIIVDIMVTPRDITLIRIYQNIS